MNKRIIVLLAVLMFVFFLLLSCEKNPFDSPNPGRLSLNLKLARGPYEDVVTKDDKLEIVVQYVKGYVDSSQWSYIIDKDSLKVINLFHINEEGNILAETVVDTIWIDSITYKLDTTSVSEPLILSDSKGVNLPPLNYKFIKIKAVLEDTIMVLGGKKYRIHKKAGTESIAIVDLDLTIKEDEWISRDLFFDLKNSIERSTSEPDHYFFQPYFYIE